MRAPASGEARIKVLAAAVCRPDVTVRRGEALYTGTPLGRKPPFVPGYAVTLILNYLVAYQTLHRAAKVSAGDRALIIGASGGIGTALLQLGRLAGLRVYGLASPSKHDIVVACGATPIDYHTQDFVEVMREAEPDGLDAVFDGMMTPSYVRRGLSLLRRGGTVVSFGEPDGFTTLFRVLAMVVGVNLRPDGKSLKLYGTSSYFVFGQGPFAEDWALLFTLLEEGKIEPVIERRFPILEAAEANALLESGRVIGNVVLVAPELLSS